MSLGRELRLQADVPPASGAGSAGRAHRREVLRRLPRGPPHGRGARAGRAERRLPVRPG